MRFLVQSDEINYGMGMVTRAVSARPIKQIYDGVLIETDEDGLILTCTDGEISIKARIASTIEEEGCAVLPAKLFAEVMRKQPSGQIEVSVDLRMRAVIRSTGSQTSMVGMEADDFPEIRNIMSEQHVSLPCKRFKDAVSKVMFAVSTDESRKILTGVLMETMPTETLLVGLDGFRLALQRIEAENTLPAACTTGVVSTVIPGRVMNELSRMIPDNDENVDIIFNASHVMVVFGGIRVYATLLTGEFIDYKKILPKQWSTEIAVKRTGFSDAIDRCSLMAREGKNNLVHLHLVQNEPMVITANAERGDAREEMMVDINGYDLDIAFNARYLTDVIHNISTDSIAMCFNSNVSPCMIRPVEGNEYTFLVLPVRIFGK